MGSVDSKSRVAGTSRAGVGLLSRSLPRVAAFFVLCCLNTADSESVSASTPGQKVYENRVLVIYELPPLRSSRRTVESVIEQITSDLTAEGILRLITVKSAVLANPLTTLVTTFFRLMPTAGAETATKLEVITSTGATNSLYEKERFLVMIALSPGDGFDQNGLSLHLDQRDGYRWRNVWRAQLLTGGEVARLVGTGTIDLRKPLLICIKGTETIGAPGRYRLRTHGLSEGEWGTPTMLRVAAGRLLLDPETVIESRPHHLGDEFQRDFTPPRAEGHCLDFPLILPAETNFARYRFWLELEHLDSDARQGYRNEVLLNGDVIAILPESGSPYEWKTLEIMLRRGLERGRNTVTLCCGERGGNHDDLMIRNIRLRALPRR